MTLSTVSSLPWMPIYTGDYSRQTRELTQAQHGAYLLLTMYYWDTQQPLPGEKTQCYRIALAYNKKEKENVNSILEKYFTLENNFYQHPDLNLLIQKTRQKIEKLRQNGALGGASSALKKTAQAPVTQEFVQPETIRPEATLVDYFKIIQSNHTLCESDWLHQCLVQYFDADTAVVPSLDKLITSYPASKKIIDRWLDYLLPQRMAAYCYVVKHTHARNELIYALQLLRHNGYGKPQFQNYLTLFKNAVTQHDYEVNFNG